MFHCCSIQGRAGTSVEQDQSLLQWEAGQSLQAATFPLSCIPGHLQLLGDCFQSHSNALTLKSEAAESEQREHSPLKCP